jgi:sulfite exporter TauE/SafE
MSEALPLAGFMLGLASGVHCAGMCGGIVAAFSSQNLAPGVVQGPSQSPRWPLLLSFNAGRIAAYTGAGALAGALGGAGSYMSGALDLQMVLFVLANLALVLIGLHLAGVSSLLSRLERIGQPVWRLVGPLAARLLPATTPGRALLAGSLWGWLPCGLVYAMLASAVAAGSARNGAWVMLAFGLGTLPNLMLAGMAYLRMRRWMTRPAVRLTAGGLVLGFGMFGLARAADLADAVRRGLLCL